MHVHVYTCTHIYTCIYGRYMYIATYMYMTQPFYNNEIITFLPFCIIMPICSAFCYHNVFSSLLVVDGGCVVEVIVVQRM